MRCNVLPLWPLDSNATGQHLNRIKISSILKLPVPWSSCIWRHIKNFHFTRFIKQLKFHLRHWLNLCQPRLQHKNHSLLQRINPKKLFAITQQLPVCRQIIFVNLHPGIQKFHLTFGQFSLQHRSIQGDNNFLSRIFSVNVRHIMLATDLAIHSDNDAIKHTQYRHFKAPPVFLFGFIIPDIILKIKVSPHSKRIFRALSANARHLCFQKVPLDII